MANTKTKLTPIDKTFLARQTAKLNYLLNEYIEIEKNYDEGLLAVAERIAGSSVNTCIRTGTNTRYFIGLHNDVKNRCGDGQDLINVAALALHEGLSTDALPLFARYDRAYRAAYRACRNYINRQKSKESLKVTSIQALFDDANSADKNMFRVLPGWQARAHIEDIVTSVTLDNIIDSIPPRLRPVLRGLLAGDTQQDIADRLHTSRGAICRHIDMIRKILSRDVIHQLFNV